MRFFDVTQSEPMHPGDVLKKRAAVHRLCRRYAVELCFLHGSLAKDRHGPLSDVDIAIYAPKLSWNRLLRLQRDFHALFHREDVDLALLHHGSSLLGMQVLTKGIPLYVRHRRVLAQFRYQTYRRYLDSQALRRRFAHYVMEACQ